MAAAVPRWIIFSLSMPALRTEFSALLLYDPDKSRSTIHCYSSRPTPLEERTMGRLFLVVELEGPDASHQQFISDLQRVVTEAYYGSEHFQVESAFERALQRTNEHLHGVVGEDLSTWLSKLHLIIAVLKDTTLHFTVIGRMHAFLVHHQRIFDILETSNGAATELPSPLKIFTNVISGQLSLDDTLLFCTTSVLDHLSQQKLKRIMTEAAPTDATRNLETLLAEAEGSSSFGAFIIRLTATPESESTTAPYEEYDRTRLPRNPQDSMERLIEREQATDTLLNHSLWLNLGRIAKSATSSVRANIGRRVGNQRVPAEAGGEQEAPAPRPTLPSRTIPKPRSATGTFGTQAVLLLSRGVASLFKVIGIGVIRGTQWATGKLRRHPVRTTANALPRSANRSMAKGSRWFQNLSPARRRVLLAAVVLLLVFSQSIVSLGNRRDAQQKVDRYREQLRLANEKITAADAALLIENEPGARALLTEAQQALGAIPDVKNAPRDEVRQTRATLETKLAAIRHAIAVDPETVADLAGLEVGFTATTLVMDGETGFTVNGESSSVFRIDVADKKATVVIDAPSLAQPALAFVTGDVPPYYLLQSDGSLQLLNTAAPSLTTTAVQYENIDRNVVDAALYNGRLYTLDTQNNQIFRHERGGGGFGLGQSWIKAVDLDIRNATSFAIDGSIYIVKADGAILKLSAGNRTETTFETVDPALAQPSLIFTNSDTAKLLVLDRSEQRIVEFTKDGDFVRQYRNDAFGNAVDIAVTESDAFVLMPTAVLRFPLTESGQ